MKYLIVFIILAQSTIAQAQMSYFEFRSINDTSSNTAYVVPIADTLKVIHPTLNIMVNASSYLRDSLIPLPNIPDRMLIPNGGLIYGNGGFNYSWSWHMTNVSLSIVMKEICDNNVHVVEQTAQNGGQAALNLLPGFCNWSAYVNKEVPLQTLGISKTVLPNLKVFPNPVRQKLKLQGTSQLKEVKLYDLLGREIPLKPLGQYTYDCSPLTPGIYHLRCISKNGGTKVVKLFVRSN